MLMFTVYLASHYQLLISSAFKHFFMLVKSICQKNLHITDIVSDFFLKVVQTLTKENLPYWVTTTSTKMPANSGNQWASALLAHYDNADDLHTLTAKHTGRQSVNYCYYLRQSWCFIVLFALLHLPYSAFLNGFINR